MKISAKLKCLILFLTLTALTAAAQDQPKTTWTEKTAAEWVTKGDWKKGLKPELHSSADKIVFAEQYHKNPAMWDKAFAFLRDSDLTKIKPGKYAIDGTNVFAIVTEGAPKEFDASAWESHKNYIDLHYVVKGQETIGAAPVAKATVTKPYNETTDNANYNVQGQYYIATPDIFFLFFPSDAHRPGIKVAGYDVVKKVVLKIKVLE
ncbi:MAG TPA: YhcH/YjgK/YiaL family protein [Mucilaginibacter sp.]